MGSLAPIWCRSCCAERLRKVGRSCVSRVSWLRLTFQRFVSTRTISQLRLVADTSFILAPGDRYTSSHFELVLGKSGCFNLGALDDSEDLIGVLGPGQRLG